MRGPSREEEKYFADAEAKRREDVRRQKEREARSLQERRKISDSVGVPSIGLAERMQALGFTGDTARVFDLMPLVHVAWADNSVSRKERSTILALVEQRGFGPGTDPHTLVESLLETRPSEEFLQETLDLLQDVTQSRAGMAGSIVEMAITVAEASGGLFGLTNPISDDEKKLLERVAEALGGSGLTALRERLGVSSAQPQADGSTPHGSDHGTFRG